MADFAKGGVFRPLVFLTFSFKFSPVPWSLKRFQQSRQLHYITFSCCRRQPRLNTPQACRLFLRQLEQVRNHPEILPQLLARLTLYLELHPTIEHYEGKLLVVKVDRIRIRE